MVVFRRLKSTLGRVGSLWPKRSAYDVLGPRGLLAEGYAYILGKEASGFPARLSGRPPLSGPARMVF